MANPSPNRLPWPLMSNSTSYPTGLRGAVGAKADVFVGADDGVAAKVPPSALEVGVEVGLD
jgi:hypothetical protein